MVKMDFTQRVKTYTLLRIPLLDEAELIIEKYQDHPRESTRSILNFGGIIYQLPRFMPE
jgi:hypothetical protein